MPKAYKVKTVFEAGDKSTRTIGKIQGKLMRMTAKASMALRKLNRVTSKVTGALTRGLKYGFASASIAATGLFVAINRNADAMDALAKKARAIDFPIEEYQEWRFVSEQSGLATDKFDKGLNTFTKRIGKLRGGFGPLQAALNKTNKPLAKVLKGTTDSAQAMDIMIDAIQGAKTAADKSMLADAAFGVTNFALIAGNSTEQLSKLRQEMRENGVVTAEQAAKAEEYNDMMNRVKKTVAGLMVDVISPMLPMLTKWSGKVRELIVDNRGIIKTKVAEYIKKIPGYIEKIAYWAPKVGKAVLAFYALSAIVKVVNVSMGIFNALTKINLGPIKAMGALMAGQLPAQIGISTAAAVALKGALVLGVGAAAVGLGLLIHKHIVDPLMKARHEANMMKAEHDRTMKGDLSKRNSAMLKDDIVKADKVAKDTKRSFYGAVAPMPYAPAGFDPMAGARSEAVDKIGRDKMALERALAARQQQDNIARYSAGPRYSDEWSIATQTQSTTHKEEVEVTIKDETGRARVTSGKSRNLKLAHTGGMP